jgi:glycosyltransferase involved in cell wall biosynthesis
MSISVVIPLYNKALHIERSLRSVLAQTIKPDEIIVVDDGSTDGGGEIVAAVGGPRIRLIRQENQGVSAARNRGIREARGELIAFLDADDAWKPRFLEVIHNLQQRYPEAGAYATAYDIVKPDGSTLKWAFDVLLENGEDGLILNYVKFVLKYPYASCSSAIAVPKITFALVGDFPLGEKIAEDKDTWLRIGLRYSIAFSKESLAVYYKDATNRTFQFVLTEDEPAISRTARQFIQSGVLKPEAIEDLWAYVSIEQFRAVHDCLVLGKRDKALQMLRYLKEYRKVAKTWWKWRLVAVLPGPITRFLYKQLTIWKKVINSLNYKLIN